MGSYQLGRLDFVFDVFCLLLSSWVVFDTRRALRVLSLNREKELKTWQAGFMRFAGGIVALAMAWDVIRALVHNR